MSDTTQPKRRILVVRPDRIGDVVLSTPVLEALKRHIPNSEIHLLVRDVVKPVVEHNSFISKILLYSPQSTHRGIGGLWRLIKEIREGQYETVVTLQVAFSVSLAVFLAGIRKRVGPHSKWYSYLFFNKGVRQARSAVEMHEADYNLMLLRRLGVKVPSRQIEPQIIVDADAKERARAFVKSLGLPDDAPFIVVHPGMGGSALNWPEGYYADLIQRLARKGVPIVVSGSVGEKAVLERVIGLAKEQYPTLPVHVFLGPSSPSGLADLIGLLSLCKIMVAPSTGPLHVAAALGKDTVSFFSPIKVQSALRWGPYSADESRHEVLVPDALCGQDFKCAGQKCHFYFCMERLGVEEAVKSVIAHWEREEKST